MSWGPDTFYEVCNYYHYKCVWMDVIWCMTLKQTIVSLSVCAALSITHGFIYTKYQRGQPVLKPVSKQRKVDQAETTVEVIAFGVEFDYSLKRKHLSSTDSEHANLMCPSTDRDVSVTIEHAESNDDAFSKGCPKVVIDKQILQQLVSNDVSKAMEADITQIHNEEN